MNEKYQIEGVDSLKSEHLHKNIKPIIACVGNERQFINNPGDNPHFSARRDRLLRAAHNVDYYGNPKRLAENNFKNEGFNSYVISPIDSLDKFSDSFLNCTGLVATGQDKETGEEISFLSHEDPRYFLNNQNQDTFTDALNRRLHELKMRSTEGTIDAVIVGGNYFTDDSSIGDASKPYREDYLASIKLLSKEVSKVLGFEPVVITGPKTSPGRSKDHIYYDNKERRLYVERPVVGDASTESYVASKLEEQEKKWNEK